MKILQLCSYYPSSKVHQELFRELDKTIPQTVIIPTRRADWVGKNRIDLSNGALIFSHIWGEWHRVLYQRKIQLGLEMLKRHAFGDIIHAHTWFSDGGIAYLNYLESGTPYMVTVRDTDLNYFYKITKFRRSFGHKILENSKKIVFLSPAYAAELENLLPVNVYEKVKHKISVIPNGVNQYWMENAIARKSAKLDENHFRVLFVGSLVPRKNIHRLIASCLKLHSDGHKVILRCIGDGGLYGSYLKRRYAQYECIDFIDPIKDKTILMHEYRNSDLFAMVSKTESFGLVYIEALTQGLPILYSSGQGVDGYFAKASHGLSVPSGSKGKLTEAILDVMYNYKKYEAFDMEELVKFQWSNIAQKYLKIYEEIQDHKS